MFGIRFNRMVRTRKWSIMRSNRYIIQIYKRYVGGCPIWSIDWYGGKNIIMRLSSIISSLGNKDCRQMIWSFITTIWLINQIRNWVGWFIRDLINPFDSLAIFGSVVVFLKLRRMSMVLEFIQPNFIKRSWMINQRVIGDDIYYHGIRNHVQNQRDCCKYHQTGHHCWW